jgi:hypothetical protein
MHIRKFNFSTINRGQFAGKMLKKSLLGQKKRRNFFKESNFHSDHFMSQTPPF